MIHQVDGFIEWILKRENGNDTLAVLISEATSQLQMSFLADVSRNMSNAAAHRAYAIKAVTELDDHLTKEGWYDTMAEDLASNEVDTTTLTEELVKLGRVS